MIDLIVENVWSFPNAVVFNMPFHEFRSFLNGMTDGVLKRVPIRILPRVGIKICDSKGENCEDVQFIDLYLSISGEIVEQEASGSHGLRKYGGTENISEVKEYRGLSTSGEVTFLNFVNAGDNIVKVYSTVATDGKIKYEHSENWYMDPELFEANSS